MSLCRLGDSNITRLDLTPAAEYPGLRRSEFRPLASAEPPLSRVKGGACPPDHASPDAVFSRLSRPDNDVWKMFSVVPDLTPRDSHSLWYVSSRSPLPPHFHEPAFVDGAGGPGISQLNYQQRRSNHGGPAHALERSAPSRLRADELYQDRRRSNVGNFGIGWLKPPGVAKTLFQLREERREQEEHAEALRREQLAQQLAEAEGNAAGLVDLDMVDDGDGDAAAAAEGERDLDDEIPDADAEGFGFDVGLSDDEEDSGARDDDDDDEDDDDDDDVEDEENDDGDHENTQAHAGASAGANSGSTAAHRREMRQMLAAEDRVLDRVLDIMNRGQGQQQQDDDLYGAEDDADEGGAEGQSAILQEDDLVHDGAAVFLGAGQEPSMLHGSVSGMDMDMHMDQDLDDDVPEAESGEYEHTDSEAELSSSDANDDDDEADLHQHAQPSFTLGRPSVSQQFMPSNNPLSFDNPRSSLDVTSILSRDGSSSIPGSSPRARRRQ